MVPFVFFLIFVCVASPSDSPSVEDSRNVFNKYIEAFKEGRTEEALESWNPEERKMYEPSLLDWLFRLKNRNDISPFEADIISEEKTEDYVRLKVRWRRKSNGEVAREESRYFIQDSGKTVLAKPVKALTKGWSSRELENIAYHARPEDMPEEYVMEEIDRFCEETSALLGVDLKRRIDCYKARDSKEVGKMFDQGPAMGRALVPAYTVVNVTHHPQYEITHIFRSLLKEGRAPTMFFRGLGIYLGGTPFFSPGLCIHWAKQALYKWGPSLDEINEKAYAMEPDPNNRYPCLSGAFVKYLIEKHGIEKFKHAYTECADWEDFKRSAGELFDQEIGGMEKDWRDWLSDLEIEAIKPGLNSNTDVIFNLRDPEYDETGDGDYVYPSGREEGICDLAGFSVLADEERVYFELDFRNLTGSEPADSVEGLSLRDWGFEDTFGRIVLSTGAESKETVLDGIIFTEPYDYYIDISGSGILLRDSYGIWVDLLRVKSEGSIRRGKKIQFSIPVSLTGKPDRSWKYQVLTGFHTGRAWMSHGAGRFMEVAKEAGREQGGGGADSDFDPDVYDILLPEGAGQAEILGGYDETINKRVTIQLVGSRN